MTKIILVSDGITDWDAASRVQGSMDIPLNNDGIWQAKKIAMALAKVPVDDIYSSAMARSYGVAREIAKVKKLKIKKLKELNALCQGLWQGLTRGEIKKRYPKHYAVWQDSPASVTPPEGEDITICL